MSRKRNHTSSSPNTSITAAHAMPWTQQVFGVNQIMFSILQFLEFPHSVLPLSCIDLSWKQRLWPIGALPNDFHAYRYSRSTRQMIPEEESIENSKRRRQETATWVGLVKRKEFEPNAISTAPVAITSRAATYARYVNTMVWRRFPATHYHHRLLMPRLFETYPHVQTIDLSQRKPLHVYSLTDEVSVAERERRELLFSSKRLDPMFHAWEAQTPRDIAGRLLLAGLPYASDWIDIRYPRRLDSLVLIEREPAAEYFDSVYMGIAESHIQCSTLTIDLRQVVVDAAMTPSTTTQPHLASNLQVFFDDFSGGYNLHRLELLFGLCRPDLNPDPTEITEITWIWDMEYATPQLEHFTVSARLSEPGQLRLRLTSVPRSLRSLTLLSGTELHPASDPAALAIVAAPLH